MIAISRSEIAAFDDFNYQVKAKPTMMLIYLKALERSSSTPIKFEERTICRSDVNGNCEATPPNAQPPPMFERHALAMS